ncbi:ABC transporter permease [Cellulomonas citrea]|uniref:ABC transporter permease n=1 Tax=Cellulomonas citrea TaxID=1909423 RepID=UPI00135BAFD3|nr:ABC transporter permease [Cellulomonas citrea]
MAAATPGRQSPSKARARSGWFASRTAEIVLPIAVGLSVIGLWYFVSYVVLSERRRFVLPPPHKVVAVGFLDGHNLMSELEGLWTTTRVAVAGLLIAMVIGFLVAILMSQAKWIETSLYPYAVVLQTIPILALVPLIAFALGYSFWSRVVVCVLIAVFPIITNTFFGLQSAEPAMHDLFTLHRADRYTRLVKLQVPASLPAVFTGLRISAGLSVIGAIVGDFFFRQGDPGIGLLIDTYRNSLQGERLYASIILSSLLGLAVFWLFGALGKAVTGSWYRPTSG